MPCGFLPPPCWDVQAEVRHHELILPSRTYSVPESVAPAPDAAWVIAAKLLSYVGNPTLWARRPTFRVPVDNVITVIISPGEDGGAASFKIRF